MTMTWGTETDYLNTEAATKVNGWITIPVIRNLVMVDGPHVRLWIKVVR